MLNNPTSHVMPGVLTSTFPNQQTAGIRYKYVNRGVNYLQCSVVMVLTTHVTTRVDVVILRLMPNTRPSRARSGAQEMTKGVYSFVDFT
jgi:hypothetical protein